MSDDVEVTLELRWWHGMGEEPLSKSDLADDLPTDDPDFHLTDGTPAWFVWFEGDDRRIHPGFIVDGARRGKPDLSVLVIAYAEKLGYPETHEALMALLTRIPAGAWEGAWEEFGEKVRVAILQRNTRPSNYSA